MSQGNLFDPPPPEDRRDEALDRVGKNAGRFVDAVRQVVPQLVGLEVTGEDIRVECGKLGIRPHHHNAWGAVINSLVREEALIFTGREVHMKTSKSHARRTRVYYVP